MHFCSSSSLQAMTAWCFNKTPSAAIASSSGLLLSLLTTRPSCGKVMPNDRDGCSPGEVVNARNRNPAALNWKTMSRASP